MTDKEFCFVLDNIENKTVFESMLKTRNKLSGYENICCSISGGGRQ